MNLDFFPPPLFSIDGMNDLALAILSIYFRGEDDFFFLVSISLNSSRFLFDQTAKSDFYDQRNEV